MQSTLARVAIEDVHPYVRQLAMAVAFLRTGPKPVPPNFPPYPAIDVSNLSLLQSVVPPCNTAWEVGQAPYNLQIPGPVHEVEQRVSIETYCYYEEFLRQRALTVRTASIRSLEDCVVPAGGLWI